MPALPIKTLQVCSAHQLIRRSALPINILVNLLCPSASRTAFNATHNQHFTRSVPRFSNLEDLLHQLAPGKCLFHQSKLNHFCSTNQHFTRSVPLVSNSEDLLHQLATGNYFSTNQNLVIHIFSHHLKMSMDINPRDATLNNNNKIRKILYYNVK